MTTEVTQTAATPKAVEVQSASPASKPSPAIAKRAVKAVAPKAASVAKTVKPAKAAKPVKAPKVVAKTVVAPKATAAALPKATNAPKALAKPKVDKPAKEKKPKLVRDSFTIPKAEYTVLDDLKARSNKLASPAKKSELLRAGIKALAAMSDAAFVVALRAVPAIKTGRPVKD